MRGLSVQPIDGQATVVYQLPSGRTISVAVNPAT